MSNDQMNHRWVRRSSVVLSTLVLAGLPLALAAPQPAEALEGTSFSYSGQLEAYEVPEDTCAVEVSARGAAGGSAAGNEDGYGRGARVEGLVLDVEPGEVLWVAVGGRGGDAAPTFGGAGGWNGGGDGGNATWGLGGGGGGGASDVRRGGQGLEHRVVVAAGGGGAGNDTTELDGRGGNGGISAGGPGAQGHYGPITDPGGDGGTAEAGGTGGGDAGDGSLGTGGDGEDIGGEAPNPAMRGGGGGGGGLFGGGGGASSVGTPAAGGGGGSSHFGGAGGSITGGGGGLGDGSVLIAPHVGSCADDGTVVLDHDEEPRAYVVPEDVCEVVVDAFGASGGYADGSIANHDLMSRGAAVLDAELEVQPGDELWVVTGGRGGSPAGGWQPGSGGEGGTNGGGDGGSTWVGSGAGGGGGATDVRIGGLELDDRVVVAGGGGGAGAPSSNLQGVGGLGGLEGTDGGWGIQDEESGEGATQISGGQGGHEGEGAEGALGQGGDGETRNSPEFTGGGGGGGGLYGGGGGAAGVSGLGAGGGGGSSLAPDGATVLTGGSWYQDGVVRIRPLPDSCPVPPTTVPPTTVPPSSAPSTTVPDEGRDPGRGGVLVRATGRLAVSTMSIAMPATPVSAVPRLTG